MAKRWIHRNDLMKIRPAEAGEMIEAGQFAQDGDMVIVRTWPDDDFLIAKRNFRNYIEVEVPDTKGDNDDE